MDSDELTHNNNSSDKRIQRINNSEEIDAKYGYPRHRNSTEKIGWLFNFQSVCYLFNDAI
jgi:hypothetical protein